MNTLLNSNSGNKTYIFKDGNLLQGVTLPPQYSIVDDYITAPNLGTINWLINLPNFKGKKLFVKFLFTSFGSGGQVVVGYADVSGSIIKESRWNANGNNLSLNVNCYNGIDIPENQSYQLRISTTAGGNSVRIYEIWYE